MDTGPIEVVVVGSSRSVVRPRRSADSPTHSATESATRLFPYCELPPISMRLPFRTPVSCAYEQTELFLRNPAARPSPAQIGLLQLDCDSLWGRVAIRSIRVRSTLRAWPTTLGARCGPAGPRRSPPTPNTPFPK